ncbi:MAG TPA: pirin family protein [Alphaproteobacteria bacterium]|nr:pirin family protein [Alphaproteobacteria bacterium]
MIVKRPGEERGRTRLSWLDSRHSFSFGEYYDPRHMGFGALRVINEDWVAPAAGFATHGHRDMEIVTYVISGALEHKDSLGTGSIIRPGEVQRMSAGTGILHSEFNPSRSDPVHLLQIWILPTERGIEPGYEQKAIPARSPRTARFAVIAGPDEDASVRIHQDARILAAEIPPGVAVAHDLVEGRRAWLQVVRGAVELEGSAYFAGDGAAISDESRVELYGRDSSELLLFDLP